jgi:hypothetical protein
MAATLADQGAGPSRTTPATRHIDRLFERHHFQGLIRQDNQLEHEISTLSSPIASHAAVQPSLLPAHRPFPVGTL